MPAGTASRRRCRTARVDTARRRARPQPRSIALATPDCISCAFITGDNVIFAPRPWNERLCRRWDLARIVHLEEDQPRFASRPRL